MSIMARADRPRAWQSWIEKPTMSANSGRRECIGKDGCFEPKTKCIISQVEYITYKKDNHKILTHTVLEEYLLAKKNYGHQWCNEEKDVVKKGLNLFLYQNASDIKIENNPLHNVTSYLCFAI